MRQITRVRGTHRGLHYIFDQGYSEAIHYLNLPQLRSLNTNGQDFSTLDCFPHWRDPNVKDGDWITTDNGVVIQLLKMYHGAETKTGQKLWEIRILKTVGGCGYYLYYLKDSSNGKKAGDIVNRSNFNVTASTIEENRARQSIGRGITFAKEKKVWKRLFVYYLVIYLSPVFAYQQMMKNRKKYGKFVNKYLTYGHCHKAAYAMLRDPFVIQELESYMKVDTFRDRLTKALEAQGVGEERIVTELVEGLDSVKKGTQTHKQFIELAMNISRYAKEKEEIDASGKAIARIETADYTENTMLPPPPRKDVLSVLDEDTKSLVNESIRMSIEEPLSPPPPILNTDIECLEKLEEELEDKDFEENSLGRLELTEETNQI